MSTETGFILIVSRNGLQLTKKAVASALAQDLPATVLLLDNASTDGTASWVASKLDFASAVYPQQVSLARAWNDGLIWAWSAGYEHALVCNNDIELRPDTYRHLLAHGGPFVTCVSVRTAAELNYPTPTTTETPHPDFSCFLIRRHVWDTVGPFNEDYYPAYCEDCDYHVRMHRAGIHAVSINLPFLHHGSGTLLSADKTEEWKIKRGADRNRERFKAAYGCLPGTPQYAALFTPVPTRV